MLYHGTLKLPCCATWPSCAVLCCAVLRLPCCAEAGVACWLQGAIIIGLLFVTFVAWIPNHAASYLGSESDIAGGLMPHHQLYL